MWYGVGDESNQSYLLLEGEDQRGDLRAAHCARRQQPTGKPLNFVMDSEWGLKGITEREEGIDVA